MLRRHRSQSGSVRQPPSSAGWPRHACAPCKPQSPAVQRRVPARSNLDTKLVCLRSRKVSNKWGGNKHWSVLSGPVPESSTSSRVSSEAGASLRCAVRPTPWPLDRASSGFAAASFDCACRICRSKSALHRSAASVAEAQCLRFRLACGQEAICGSDERARASTGSVHFLLQHLPGAQVTGWRAVMVYGKMKGCG